MTDTSTVEETTEEAAAAPAAKIPPRLKVLYHDSIKAQLKEDLGLENVMQVPRMEKIVILSLIHI